jgi:hypothetical protein
MVKLQKIKLEFTSNTTCSFNIDMYINNPIECAIKSAGKIQNNFFTALYKFSIDTHKNIINNIHFHEVKHINNEEMTQSNMSYNFTDITEYTFEQSIYNYLSNMLLNATINNNIVSLNNLDIDYLVLHIKIGSDNYNYSSSNNEKTLECNDIHNNLDCQNNPEKTNMETIENSKSYSSKKHRKTKKKNPQSKKTLKLVTWSSMMVFMMHIFKSKIYKHKNNN